MSYSLFPSWFSQFSSTPRRLRLRLLPLVKLYCERSDEIMIGSMREMRLERMRVNLSRWWVWKTYIPMRRGINLALCCFRLVDGGQGKSVCAISCDPLLRAGRYVLCILFPTFSVGTSMQEQLTHSYFMCFSPVANED
jgi:hypothetical protein